VEIASKFKNMMKPVFKAYKPSRETYYKIFRIYEQKLYMTKKKLKAI
jgi:hypothetical protein